MNPLNLKSREVNARTNTPPDVITPLHPVLPADIAEIPTAQTVMKHFPMVIPFLHTAMTMTTALSLQNQLQMLPMQILMLIQMVIVLIQVVV